MDDASPVPRAPLPTPAHHATLRQPTTQPSHASNDIPFMNNMDEISYWITTKQAPCLFNYDNVIKRQCVRAQASKPISVHSMVLDASPKKKKKRKLSLLDDESLSSGKQHNLYFDTSQNKNQITILNSCKSDTLGSDLNFNIKSPSLQNKSKKTKFNKSNKAVVHKKNKIVTSTPKAVGILRRSLRKTQRTSDHNGHPNDSFEVLNGDIVNRNGGKYNNVFSGKERLCRIKKTPEAFAGGDLNTPKKSSNETNKLMKVNSGQFDDMSDVSGFTANYIRSTKLHSSRNNIRKGNRNFIKESNHVTKNDDNSMLICLNKSVNTGLSKTPLMNCSMDSSQNVLNLVSLKTNDRSAKINKSTSLLKFMDARIMLKHNVDDKGISSNEVNISFQSKSSLTSRYPIRNKNVSINDGVPKGKMNKNSNEFHNSDRKENPVENSISRTRSGRRIGLMLQHPENSVLVLSNSKDPVSSIASINVATPNNQMGGRSKRRSCISLKPLDSAKKSIKNDRRESLRDKSGFAACFSESDEDNGPMRHKKFFC
ncbi:unnamed protein product [Chilo suppressalis]|uniref:Uncharacterized protein n=1 Tax=Chilo suppressalis TaxID=168631 RepID=A0ABN8BAH2_CHISP|nr:unnamed protein product [Chilo suppressalis]